MSAAVYRCNMVRMNDPFCCIASGEWDDICTAEANAQCFLTRGDGNKRPIVITLFARGTGDENVCAGDLEDFKGVATICSESEGTCITCIESLLRRDVDGSVSAKADENEPHDHKGWTIIAENEPIQLRQVERLLNHFRGREIRVCLGSGMMETGELEYCSANGIWFASGRSISGWIARIEVRENSDAE